MSPRRYLVVLSVFGLQRLVELRYSIGNERRLRARGATGRQAAARSFKWIFLLNGALFTLPLLERRWRAARPVPAVAVAIGLAGALTASALRIWTVRTLGESWNIRAIVPTRLQIVDRGPYRWVRHPNYLALIIEFAALPLMGGAYLSGLFLSGLNGVLLRLRILDEERLLMEEPDYRRLMAAKPRFFPRWRDTKISLPLWGGGNQYPVSSAIHWRGDSRRSPQ
jgi:methyltransferase